MDALSEAFHFSHHTMHAYTGKQVLAKLLIPNNDVHMSVYLKIERYGELVLMLKKML
jgi:hypothetical protein